MVMTKRCLGRSEVATKGPQRLLRYCLVSMSLKPCHATLPDARRQSHIIHNNS